MIDLSRRTLVEIAVRHPPVGRQGQAVSATVHCVTSDCNESRPLQSREHPSEEALVDGQAVPQLEPVETSACAAAPGETTPEVVDLLACSTP